MKKTLLTLALALAGFSANSQVIFAVEAPASITGNYQMTYTTTANGWGTIDMMDPANVIVDTIVLANDTSPTQDSLMCLAAAPGSLTGKIAMLYRGDCEFGTKAKNAQNAGAVAIIIVTNDANAPIAMSPGSGTTPAGASVTIPVIMITKADGAIISAKIRAGEHVVGFIGNKSGFFNVDLGTNGAKVKTASLQAIPLAVAMNSTEFPVALGAWAFNYGSVLQTGVTMTAEVKKNGTSIYTQVSSPFDFVAATTTEDSVWIDFPAFAPASYSVGTYEISYTINAAGDQYIADNKVITNFEITDNLISLARVDANGLPRNTGGIQPGTPTGNAFSSCIVFKNAHASRIGAAGLYFGIQKNAADGAVTGEEVLLQGYKWSDSFTDLDDPNFSITMLEEMGSGTYSYQADLQDTILYKAFDTPFLLEDNQRYIFCLTSFSSDFKVFHAHDTEVKYDQVELAENQPLTPINNGGTPADWNGVGFASRPIPSIGVRTFAAAELGLADVKLVEASVYPNPAKEKVIISIKGFKGDAEMTVTDVAGKIVIKKAVTTDDAGKVVVNMNELNNGMYIFNLQLADGTVSKFNVVVNK